MSFRRYSAYKDSRVEWLGDVPNHWDVYSLKRAVEGCVNGIWGGDPDGECDIPVIRVADFDRTKLRVGLGKLTYRSIPGKDRSSRSLKFGDLLIEKSGGGDKTLVGCTVLFEHEFEAVTSNFVARMRPVVGINSIFLCYAFDTLYQGKINYPAIKQTTGIQNLDAEAYLQERFSFPSHDEQAHIAHFLDHETAKIDTLIKEQQRLIELLKEKRQAVISHAVTKGLDPNAPMKDSGVEWLGEVPAHWNITPLKHLMTLNPVKSAFTGDHSQLCSFIPMEKLKTGHIVLDEERVVADVFGGYTYFENGDVLQAKVTPCFENKNIAIAEQLTNGVGFGSTEINACRPNENVSSRFLFYRLQEDTYMSVCTASMTGAGGLKRVPTDTIEEFRIALPDIREQSQIVLYLDQNVKQLDDLTAHATNGIDLLRERRSALISAAVTGKIDVRSWQPPASPASTQQENMMEFA